MPKIIYFLISGLIYLLCTKSIDLYGQNITLHENLTNDSTVIIKKLENGLTYYIRENNMPSNRIELRLVVNAGSLQENENQKGIAHFCEHLCFNGTSHFPGNSLTSFLESAGLKSGAHINAHTGFGETVFKLQIAADDSALIDSAFLVLEEWAHNVSFDSMETEKERGVILEEWRLGLCANGRMMNKYLPVILNNSKFATHLPIGDTSIIRNCSYNEIRDFYKDWYRPELMAVIVVGDISHKKAKQLIKKHFADIKPVSGTIRQHYDYRIADNSEPLISITQDMEATSSSLQLFVKQDKKTIRTIANYRNFVLIPQLFCRILNQRLREIMQQPNAPYIVASASFGGFFSHSQQAFSVYTIPKDHKITETYRLILTEILRLQQHGITREELDLQKTKINAKYKRFAATKNSIPSNDYIENCIQHFIENEPIIDYQYLNETINEILPDISTDEVNVMAHEWFPGENTAIVVTSPLDSLHSAISEKKIIQVLSEIKAKQTRKYISLYSDKPLLNKKLEGSKVIRQTRNKKFGFTEIMLQNRVKIVVKPTSYKNNEILFSAISPGGHSVYSDNAMMSAYFASEIINLSGIGNFDNTNLHKKLSGNSATVIPCINEIDETLQGGSNSEDIETLLQLIYLYFTSPRKDTTAYKSFISRLRDQLKYAYSCPQVVFQDTIIKTITNNNPRVLSVPTDQQIDKIDLDTIFNIYRDRFDNAGDFTFFFAGDIDIEQALPLFELYLGELPANRRKEKWNDVLTEFPEGITKIEVRKGQESRSSVAIIMNDSFRWNFTNRLKLKMLTELLNLRLQQILREDMGEIYQLRVYDKSRLYPSPEYSLNVYFGCAPDSADSVVDCIFKEMKHLQNIVPSKDDIIKIKKSLKRQRELNEQSNSFWISSLEKSYFRKDKLMSCDEFAEEVDKISCNDMKKAAQKYIETNHYVKVVLLPQERLQNSQK